MADLEKLFRFEKETNIAPLLDDNDLNKIGGKVWEGYELDEDSRTDWKEQNKRAMKLAKQVIDQKTFPWQGAANVKYPLITTAALQFNARAYSEIIQSHEIVKARVIGEDPENIKQERAKRVGSHMSYQLIEEMPEWEEETDRLLMVLSILGMYYRKSYWCPIKRRNVSETWSPEYVVVNNNARNLETARRISHRLFLYKNDIYEYVENGLWVDIRDSIGNPDSSGTPDENDNNNNENDDDGYHEFIEQHCYLDLDEDGYEEPYIVTIHARSKKVVRIKSRYRREDIYYIPENEKYRLKYITPVQYFTKFYFIPDPEGKFHDIGFGILLEPLNESINTLINELLDSGALANSGGGFIAQGVRIKGGDSGSLQFKLGEWKKVQTTIPDLRAGLMPLPVKEPSQVLYLLLGFLVNAAQDISSVKDVMLGEKPGENVSAETVYFLVEQGLKQFSAIYKRVYRSLTKEFRKLYKLNSVYLEEKEYFTFLDTPMEVAKGDYNTDDLDIKPVADPHIVSNAQKLALAQAAMAASGRPGVNEYNLTELYYDSLGHGTRQKVVYTPEEWQKIQSQPPPIPPEVQEKLARLEMDKRKLPFELEEMKMKIATLLKDLDKTDADIILTKVKAHVEALKPMLEAEELDIKRDAVEEKSNAKED